MGFALIEDPKANYISDIYINNKYLMEGLKNSFKLSLNESLKLIKFLEYIPSSWNINDALDTKVKDLKVEDLKRLEIVKRDLMIAHTIKEKLRGNTYDLDIYDYATKIDINKLIGYKFDVDAIRKKYNYTLNVSLENRMFFIEVYNNKFDRSMEEEVVLHLLKEDIKNKTKTR